MNWKGKMSWWQVMLVVHKWDGNSPFEMCNLAWNISFGSWLILQIQFQVNPSLWDSWSFTIFVEKAQLIWSFQIPDNLKNDL